MIKNLFKNYMERIKWVILLKGDRLTPFHYDEIRKKAKEDEEEENEEDEEKEQKRLKIIYNNQEIINEKKNEIKFLKRKKKFKKKD